MLSALFRRLTLLLGGALLPLALAAQTPPVSPAPPVPDLSWLDQQLRTSPVLRQHQVGLSLADATTGQTLFGFQHSRYFTPASTTSCSRSTPA